MLRVHAVTMHNTEQVCKPLHRRLLLNKVNVESVADTMPTMAMAVATLHGTGGAPASASRRLDRQC